MRECGMIRLLKQDCYEAFPVGIPLLYVIPASAPLALFLGDPIGLRQVAHKAKCRGGLGTLARHYALDEVPRDYQLQTRYIDRRDPDAGTVIRLRKPPSH